MKKLLFVFVAVILTFITMPSAITNAEGSGGSSINVNGKITNNGKAVNKANVSVTCRSTTLTDTTNGTGTYSVTFNSNQCANGNTVTVTAVSGSLSGSSSANVVGNSCNANVAIFNVNIPEFGALTTLSATVISGGAFLAVRRRSQGENKA